MTDQKKTTPVAANLDLEFSWDSNSASGSGYLSTEDKIAVAQLKLSNKGLKNDAILKQVLGDRYDSAPAYFRNYPGTVIHQVQNFCRTQYKRFQEMVAANEDPSADETIKALIDAKIFKPKAKA